MKYIVFLIFLTSCFSSKSTNSLEEISKEVINEDKGVEIRITPVEKKD